jgi:hypothetical protein
MFNKISKLIVIAVFGFIVSGCANSDFSHKYMMKGQVVLAENDNIVVCIGLDDGAKVGQILDVYKFVMNDDNDEGADFFMQVKTGKVKISKIINEHFAKITVLEGTVKQNNMVQLKIK